MLVKKLNPCKLFYRSWIFGNVIKIMTSTSIFLFQWLAKVVKHQYSKGNYSSLYQHEINGTQTGRPKNAAPRTLNCKKNGSFWVKTIVLLLFACEIYYNFIIYYLQNAGLGTFLPVFYFFSLLYLIYSNSSYTEIYRLDFPG